MERLWRAGRIGSMELKNRALICQPDFIARMKRGEREESACLACNGCYRVYRQRPVRCVQHQETIPQLEKAFFA